MSRSADVLERTQCRQAKSRARSRSRLATSRRRSPKATKLEATYHAAVPRPRADGADELHGACALRRLRGLGRHPGHHARARDRGQGHRPAAREGHRPQPSDRRRLRPPAGGRHIAKAVRIAQQVDGPVKVVWTREEDIQHDALPARLLRPLRRDADGRQDRRPGATASPARRSSRAGCPRPSQNGIDFDAVDSAVDMPYDIAKPSRRICARRAAGRADRLLARRRARTTTSSSSKASSTSWRSRPGKDPVAFRRAMLDEDAAPARVPRSCGGESGLGKRRCRRARPRRRVPERVRPASSRRSRRWRSTTMARSRIRRVTAAVDCRHRRSIPTPSWRRSRAASSSGSPPRSTARSPSRKAACSRATSTTTACCASTRRRRSRFISCESGEAPGGIGETGHLDRRPGACATRSSRPPACALRSLPIDRKHTRGEESRVSGHSARILLAAIAIIVVAGLGIVGWIVFAPGPTDFAGGDRVALADYQGADPTGVPADLKTASLVDRGRISRPRRRLRGLPHGARRPALRRRPRLRPALRDDLFHQHHARHGNRHRQIQRRGLPGGRPPGRRRDGARLYPAMPFASYTYLTDADALAIKAYLFSLKPVDAPAIPNTLRLSRSTSAGLMGIWAVLFNADTRVSSRMPTAARSGTAAPIWSRRSPIAANAIRRAICCRRWTTGANSPARHRRMARL